MVHSSVARRRVDLAHVEPCHASSHCFGYRVCRGCRRTHWGVSAAADVTLACGKYALSLSAAGQSTEVPPERSEVVLLTQLGAAHSCPRPDSFRSNHKGPRCDQPCVAQSLPS